MKPLLVGELRKLLNGVPDDMPVGCHVYNHTCQYPEQIGLLVGKYSNGGPSPQLLIGTMGSYVTDKRKARQGGKDIEVDGPIVPYYWIRKQGTLL